MLNSIIFLHKNALIAIYNDVKLPCELLAFFQLKNPNHIWYTMPYLQETRCKITWHGKPGIGQIEHYPIPNTWKFSDLEQDKLQTHITFRHFMNAYHVISKIHCLVPIKNAFITFYNDVELSCEHLATFQLKTHDHIYHIMYNLQKTRLKISEFWLWFGTCKVNSRK